jgi:hypothetical protein
MERLYRVQEPNKFVSSSNHVSIFLIWNWIVEKYSHNSAYGAHKG